jgi:hypothetical protein
MRKHVIRFADCADDFRVFQQLINDATRDLAVRKTFLPNPSDMFEGEESFDVYRLGLVDAK